MVSYKPGTKGVERSYFPSFSGPVGGVPLKKPRITPVGSFEIVGKSLDFRLTCPDFLSLARSKKQA